jgi:hypothetical protein
VRVDLKARACIFGIRSDAVDPEVLVDARRRGIEDRWEPIAGPGSLGASYLPCCPARLLGVGQSRVDEDEGRATLALLWSERAAALRFRRSVLAMTARAPDEMLELARIRREAFAYDAGAARLRALGATKVAWLIRLLQSRSADPVVGAALATMSAELSVLLLAARLVDLRDSVEAATTTAAVRVDPRSA